MTGHQARPAHSGCLQARLEDQDVCYVMAIRLFRVAWDRRKGRAVDAQEQRQFAALVQAVLELQEAERKWGPGDLTVLQAKERLFDMANNFILVQETDVKPAREAERQRAKVVAEVVAERMEYAVSETPAGDAGSPELTGAVIAIREAIDVIRNRELIGLDLKEKFERLLDAASDLAGELARNARSVGLAVGEAGGRAVAQVAGEADFEAALLAARSAQVDQQRRPPQRDGGIEISGP